MSINNLASGNLQSKSHYEILDGLRGVAAIVVIFFHVCEPIGGNPLTQLVNHGYLAVDFFFVLSGFVIGYSYDDRWNRMSLKDFFKRRVIRLQPMLILGTIVGALLFYLGKGSAFPPIQQTPVWLLLIVAVINCTVLPIPLSMDIRGWSEMHPLNGPTWSLFFEYIANLLYALFFKRFSKRVLSVLVIIFGLTTIHMLFFTAPQGDVIGGWSLNAEQLHIGFVRLLYPFFAGLLLSRIGTKIRLNNGFLWTSLLIIIILAMPRIGGNRFYLNALYETICILFLFPLIVSMGAGSTIVKPRAKAFCNFLGRLSYPLYISHYPLIYTFVAWMKRHPHSSAEIWIGGVLTDLVALVLAYLYLRFYDEPVRKWLTNRFVRKQTAVA